MAPRPSGRRDVRSRCGDGGGGEGRCGRGERGGAIAGRMGPIHGHCGGRGRTEREFGGGIGGRHGERERIDARIDARIGVRRGRRFVDQKDRLRDERIGVRGFHPVIEPSRPTPDGIPGRLSPRGAPPPERGSERKAAGQVGHGRFAVLARGGDSVQFEGSAREGGAVHAGGGHRGGHESVPVDRRTVRRGEAGFLLGAPDMERPLQRYY
mmetsp:Transcript_37214/g.111410  ORF Transcript_37214/g.111410 Transcript_37214/m.111410 type:complete len:210 (+) Transcript_37214:388-1017(+)